MSDDLREARMRRAKIRKTYDKSLDGWLAPFEASWRGHWVDHCAKTGSQMSFDEWFFTHKEFEIVGDEGKEIGLEPGWYTPFDIAGIWPA